MLLNAVSPATNVPYGSSNFFRLQAGSAGAGNVTITITDAVNPSCTFSVIILDPGSCSTPMPLCELLTSGLSAVTCNNNATAPNTADDYITFTLNPTGNNLSLAYSLTVSSGSVTLLNGNPATGIAYGVATTFRLQNGSAGGGNVTIFIADSNDPDCVLSVPIVDPGTCSAVACMLVCPAPQTVSCASTVPVANPSLVTATGCGAVTFLSDVISNQTCPNRYTITRTYQSGATSCTQTITVNDQNATYCSGR